MSFEKNVLKKKSVLNPKFDVVYSVVFRKRKVKCSFFVEKEYSERNVRVND